MNKLIPGPRFANRPEGKPQLVLTDIDNTLLPNESRDLPNETLTNAFREAARKLPIGVVTARPSQSSLYLLDHLRLTGPSIFSNGAQIYDGKTKKIIVEYSMLHEITKEIITELTKQTVSFWIQDNGTDYPSNTLTDYTPDKPFIIVVNRVTKDLAEKTITFMTKYDNQNIHAFIAHEYTNERWETVYDVFVADKRANKATALHEISQRTGVPLSHFMAIGDGHNDKVLLENAGWAIAMGNAVPEVKRVATFIAPSREENGAAVAIKELID